MFLHVASNPAISAKETKWHRTKNEAYFCPCSLKLHIIWNYTKRKNIIFFTVAPCVLKSILFTHQQMHCLLNSERFKIYTNIAPTCFGLRPSSGSLY
jgi:predicted permease